MRACPEHGPPPSPEHRFCEVCGRNLVTGAAVPVPTVWLSSRAGLACLSCGATGSEMYCDNCGRRRSVGRDHAELDLSGAAAVTDRGRRRPRNEDAVAIARYDGGLVSVVCDGVSTSSRSDAASHGAVEAGLAALLDALTTGVDPAEATTLGAHAAAKAARAAAGPDESDTPPSCTYVSGVVTADAVTVGWIGDSRAYWLGAEPACLTIDDSIAGQLAAGRPAPATVEADPTSRALIRWLGADSEDAEPQVVTVRPGGEGRLLLCSDGLHHYLSDPAELTAAATGSPIEAARHLTAVALDGGGHDNIAVAVLSFPTSSSVASVAVSSFAVGGGSTA
ncbi:protein phosphatase 2C domain-containing protein [Phytohabitans sp. ZYX-F-186]|uniref:Protein phosphatase 2C domain-containing protein n=1 Tax=Phytohabitans maris TaxID=3071409 RepID=A0ABU0ZN30_9ACTN|nr:protein phosphatase 2C domain-containing protein [Phytohabitans sp. ZYX-F-186]MDQ7908441.1 protein phosphatase 2C domain-containing protein [Phytohabitans sp. ZYX-F-186]